MRYFSSNITQVIGVDGFGDFRTSTQQGLTNLESLAAQLTDFFEVNQSEVLAELILAIERGKEGLDEYFRSTSWTPARAGAMWTIVRVVFDTYKYPGTYRGRARSQGIVCDLNRGLTLLVIINIDYEGKMTDSEITFNVR